MKTLTERSTEPLLRSMVRESVKIAFKLQMIVANCMLKESVLQKSHPNTNLNFQSDAIGIRKITQEVIKNKKDKVKQ